MRTTAIHALQRTATGRRGCNRRPGRDLPRKGIYLVSSGMMVEHTPIAAAHSNPVSLKKLWPSLGNSITTICN